MYWNEDNLHRLFRLYVGTTYGEYPAQNIDAIAAAKAQEAIAVMHNLQMNQDSVVLDIGPGCGFIAKAIAPKVSKLYCADVSEQFLAYTKQTCPEAECELIEFADLSSFYDKGLTHIYCLAVVIHFNVYDLYLYLEQCAACLQTGGKVLLDYLNVDYMNPSSDMFQRHAKRYKQDRTNIFTNTNYLDFGTVWKLAQKVGFEVTRLSTGEQEQILLTRM